MLGTAPAAAAAPLGLEDCGPAQGVHQCSGLVRTWDGVPLDTTLTLPAADARDLPLVVEIHGFGNSKHEYLDPAATAYTDNAFAWARDGYAVLTYTARGLWGSCGTPESRLANPAACASGYIHLADVRYEVRDTQELIGRLVDEGVADRRADRRHRRQLRGRAVADARGAARPRRCSPTASSCRGEARPAPPLRIAAAAPVIPWTRSRLRRGPERPRVRQRDHAALARHLAGRGREGVGGQRDLRGGAVRDRARPAGRRAVRARPPDGVPGAAGDRSRCRRELAGWRAPTPASPTTIPRPRRSSSSWPAFTPPTTSRRTGAHRPCCSPPASPTTCSRPTRCCDSRTARPAATRACRSRCCSATSATSGQRTSRASASGCCARSTPGSTITCATAARAPRDGVTAFAQTCPRSAPPRGPFRARSFARLARGELRGAWRDPQALSSAGGDPETGAALDPAAGGGDGCVELDAGRAPGTATYPQPVARARGVTLIGAPTVSADLAIDGAPPANTQIAARLWDVARDGQTRRLVARGLYRPAAQGRATFQLHPAAWKFEAGHTIELELLGADAPYARPSNGGFETEVSRLKLRLPVRQRPDCALVKRPGPQPLLDGQRLAPGAAGRPPARCPR